MRIMLRHTPVLIMLGFAISVTAQTGLRSVDFKNFTYEPSCAPDEMKKITVKNGSFSQEKQMEDYIDRFYFEIFNVVLGDLDNDKQEEAIVLSTCNTGGSGNFTEGFVYKSVSGRPILSERIEGGDRAYGGLKSAKVVDGSLIVERYNPGEHGASCCPELILTSKYKMTNGKLAEVGQQLRKTYIRLSVLRLQKEPPGRR